MSSILHKLLRRLARRTIRRYKPRIIGITGSVGKTSTREAIKAALGESQSIRVATGNYNNEIGLPLTILGDESKGKSLFGWLGVLWRGWRVSWGGDKSYPRVLVLEYGADKKGDIGYLTSVARPHIAVITAIAVAHTEFFGTIEDVTEEKSTLVRALPDDGIAILNADDEKVSGMRHIARGGVVTYGLGSSVDIGADNVEVEQMKHGDVVPGDVLTRLRFRLRSANEEATVSVDNIVGDAHVRAMVAGAAVAMQLEIPAADIARNLKAYSPSAGRMRLIPGIKRSLLLDDTYNASPASVHAALEVLGSFSVDQDSKRVAVLGDMLELGRYSDQAHEDVGAHVANLPIDLLVTVGELGRRVARGALDAGMEQEKVVTYARSPDAARHVQDRLERADVLLIKGSQGSRMEKVVKEIMAEPLKAPELLVRQSNKWRKS